MANVTKTVHKTTGDYSTVQSAVNDCSVYIQAGSWYKVEITDAADYNERVTSTGEVTTPTSSHYLWITAASGVKHSGVAGTGHARIVSNWSNGVYTPLTIGTDYTRVSDLEIDQQDGTQSGKGGVSVEADNVLIERCVIVCSGAQTGSAVGVWLYNVAASVSIDNCVVHGFGRAGIYMSNWEGSVTQTVNVDHCSVFDCGDAGQGESKGIGNYKSVTASTQTLTMYNNASAGIVNGPAYGSDGPTSTGFTVAGSHNLEDDTDELNAATDTTTNWVDASTGGITTTTTTASAWIVTNITGGSEDLDLVAATGAGSNLAVTGGTDRQGSEADSRADYSTDIAGNTRPTSNVDVGAFQISTASGTSANAEAASVTVTANAAAVAAGVSATAASVTATANDATATTVDYVTANAEAASVTVTANDATVTVSGSANANAETATVTATAYNASVTATATAEAATVTATAQTASTALTVSAEAATVTVTAYAVSSGAVRSTIERFDPVADTITFDPVADTISFDAAREV